MTQQTTTFLMQGGLDLVTPAVAVPPGKVIAAVNYEPEVGGYRRIGGYERFDGQTAPSAGADASEISANRTAITTVPGVGPIRGVWVFDGAVHVFRDTASGEGAMYRSTASGWEQQSFGHMVHYTAGTAAFVEGETVSGGTSLATGTIERAVIRSGTFSGLNAAGYLVVSSKTGTFQNTETITSTSGSATCSGEEAVTLSPGGRYVCFTHNYYGLAKRPRMYFANGVNTAMEWDGEVLAPVLSGTDEGPTDLAAFVLNASGDKILLPDDGRVLLYPDFDLPLHCAQFANHLFLGFRNGGVVFSGVGEPLDFRSTVGAGAFSFADEITNFLSAASTALIVTGRDRISYLTGNDASDFVLRDLSESSGAFAYTVQMLDQPFFMDDAGLRKMSTTEQFGDWRLGTETQPIEPLMRTKREAGVQPVASLKVTAKDQYRLFWNDGTGLIMYFGRKKTEAMPIKLPIDITCACAGEVSTADGGSRLFVGADDGYVYEMDKGTSFDGSAIPAYARLVWNTLGAPRQNKRFHKAVMEIDAPGDVTLGTTFHVDYSRRQDGTASQVDTDVDAGSRSDWVIDDYDSIDWTQPDQGELEVWLDTFGLNIAITVLSETATEQPHTLSAMALNFTPRRTQR